MKKGISILIFLLLTGVAGLYGKKISHIITAKPETKTIHFRVFAGTDYSTSLYKKSRAKVVLTVCKFVDDRQEVIWEGVIDEGRIKNYPPCNNPVFREVSVHNVFDRDETLAAYYKVIYDYKGSRMFYEEGITLSPGSLTDSLNISI
jgi:hypothetical protein